MKPLLLLLFLVALAALPARAQLSSVVIVERDDPVVAAISQLEKTIAEKLGTQITNQDTQIRRATALNESIGDWSKVVPLASAEKLGAADLTKDYTSDTRGSVVLNYQATTPTKLVTATGQTVAIDAADLADYDQLDQIGQGSKAALDALATEIQSTNQEVATTYEAMTQAGLDQQTYEKLLGKLQALNLHLQGLQAQQRGVFDLLQGQATMNRNKLSRDSELAAQIQKA
ncbi:MAG: hypothetical protein ACHQ5A_15190, partial [Opitutales bacterium]